MADKTGISWTDATWNPVTGCTKVSQGCKNCYAEREWARLSVNPKAVSYYGRAFTDVACHEDRLGQPLIWRKPRMIFVNSMSDLFHESVPDAFIDQVFAVMALAEKHIFQVLTKRPERMLEYLQTPGREDIIGGAAMQSIRSDCYGVIEWPIPNIWLGISAEDQETADARIPILMQAPAALRWVSAEPLLGSIEFDPDVLRPYHDSTVILNQGINWIVVGGESGPGARPMYLEWVTRIQDQCQKARVPFFFKQWGEWIPFTEMGGDLLNSLYRPRKVAKANEDQEALNEEHGMDLMVEQKIMLPSGMTFGIEDPAAFGKDFHGAKVMFRAGKNRTGCLLSGKICQEWAEAVNSAK